MEKSLLPYWAIQQQICTRLTSHSNAMGYDPIYIWHCYDIMTNLASSCNNTILVTNRGLTVSEDKHNNLVVRGSGDSSTFGSVDSKYTMKNICTLKKYIYWSYF